METKRQSELHSLGQKTRWRQLHFPISNTLDKSADGAKGLTGLMEASQSGDARTQRARLRTSAVIATTLRAAERICEMLIYRLDGGLSVIFVTEIQSDAEALRKANEFARHGYDVEIWRNGIEVKREVKGSEDCTNVMGRIGDERMRHRGK